MSEKMLKSPQFIQNMSSPCISLTLLCPELLQHAFLHITVPRVITFFKKITSDPFLFLRSFLIWYMHQNYFWSWYLVRSCCKHLCAALFPHSFIHAIIALCIWFPSLAKVCFSAAFPLCPSTTSSLLFPLFCAAGYPDGFLQMLCILCTAPYTRTPFPSLTRVSTCPPFSFLFLWKDFSTATPCNSSQSDSIQYVWIFQLAFCLFR